MAEETDEDGAPDRETEIREAQLLEALDRDGEVRQMAELLGNESVRDLLWRVLVRCHVFNTTYSRNYGDMACAEGNRQIGLWLLSEIGEANPDAMMAMQLKAGKLSQVQALKGRRQRARRAPRD